MLDIFRCVRRAAEKRRTIRELSSLDDRALRDIGISRCDIYRVARQKPC